MDRAKIANDYHDNGFSCAQAVACAFQDVIGLSEEKIAALMGCFGGGLRAGEACGVIRGAAMVLGASPHRAFFETTLPGLLPGVLSSVSMGFVLSYSQYFTTLMVGGGRVKTIALVLVPYIQSGDRALSAVYSVAFVGSALAVFFLFEGIIHLVTKGGDKA